MVEVKVVGLTQESRKMFVTLKERYPNVSNAKIVEVALKELEKNPVEIEILKETKIEVIEPGSV